MKNKQSFLHLLVLGAYITCFPYQEDELMIQGPKMWYICPHTHTHRHPSFPINTLPLSSQPTPKTTATFQSITDTAPPWETQAVFFTLWNF